MSLALLIGARPSILKNGPNVKVPPGRWRVNSNALDSVLQATINSPSEAFVLEHEALHKDGFDGPCIISLTLIKVGTERYLNAHIVALEQ